MDGEEHFKAWSGGKRLKVQKFGVQDVEYLKIQGREDLGQLILAKSRSCLH